MTQSRTLDSAEKQVADYVETLTGERPPHVDVIVDSLAKERRSAAAARRATARAEQMQREAAAENRAAAKGLRDAGLSVSDTAYIMGVSRGRVSQLIK
ncbi:antitoxin HicB [Branchiibius hedensis]|uniref:antitoxin HicB n=1 Tax=Branchiibius hedensis TaxID=672460 RepID=UPI001B87C8EB|nr:antitoxin HicB [Branchiibius hedensis]